MKAPNLRSVSPGCDRNVVARHPFEATGPSPLANLVRALHIDFCDSDKPICPRNFFQYFCCRLVLQEKIRFFYLTPLFRMAYEYVPFSVFPQFKTLEQTMPIQNTIQKQSHTCREHVKINGLTSAIIAMALGEKK